MAAIELALMLTFVLVPLTFGITELGRAAYQYNTMAKGVRDAARYLTAVTPGQKTAEAQCLATTGDTASSGSGCASPPLVAGLTRSKVTVCDRVLCPGTHNLVAVDLGAGRRGTTNLVTVTISDMQFTSLVGFVIPSFVFGPISATFAVKA